MRTPNYEAEANKLPIDTILLALFDIDVPGGASNWKTHCPLGYEHLLRSPYGSLNTEALGKAQLRNY